MENKKGANELVYKTETELQMVKADLCLPGCKGMEGSTGRMGLIYIHYYIFNR